MPDEAADRRKIAVVGSGVTGLAAAHRLGELISERHLPIDVTLLESQSRAGGLVGSLERDGYLIDLGADSFITNKPRIIPLCERLGLLDRLQATDPTYRGALVLSRGKPVPVPEGFQLLSPSSLWPVMTSPILSPAGKLRLAWEYFVPRRTRDADESLASFVRRRFGNEALERLVQPLVGGIYTSDPEQLSLRATLPRFPEMERKYGSLIKASRLQRSTNDGGDRTSGGARYGLFAGLQGGMQEFIDRLRQRVSACVTVREQTTVQTMSHESATEGRIPRYRLNLADGSSEEFDGVILTAPTHRTANLVDPLDSELATALRQIDYASSAIVVSGYPLSQIAHPLNSFGLVIPHRERRRILAVSFSSRKFPNRAPAGRVLLRTFVGGALQPELLEHDDPALLQIVREELQETLGVQGQPDFELVMRYPRAMPQYTLGHLERVAQIERLTHQHPGLAIAGNAFHGVGLPDSVASGEQAAEKLLAVLSSSNFQNPATTPINQH